MKKYILALFLLLILPSVSSAYISVCSSSEPTPTDSLACINERGGVTFDQYQEQIKERAQIELEKKEVERILQEQTASQKEADLIQKENEYQTKIKELEDRLNKLETQESIIKTETSTKDIQVNPIVIDKKLTKPSVEKKEETKKTNLINETNIIKTSIAPIVDIPKVESEKPNWFKRFLIFFWLV